MKRVATVIATAVTVATAAASGASAAWLAGGAGTATGGAATFTTPSLNSSTSGPAGSRTTCGGSGPNKKVTARWSLPSGGQTPASFTLNVGGAADPVSIAGTAREATSTNSYSGSKTVTITANLGAWNEVSNSVTVTC